MRQGKDAGVLFGGCMCNQVQWVQLANWCKSGCLGLTGTPESSLALLSLSLSHSRPEHVNTFTWRVVVPPAQCRSLLVPVVISGRANSAVFPESDTSWVEKQGEAGRIAETSCLRLPWPIVS